MAHDGPAALDGGREPSSPTWSCWTSACPGWTATRWPGACEALEGLDQALLVALTGYGQEEDRRRSHEAGFDHHLVKPVDPETLKDLLAQPPAARAAGRGRGPGRMFEGPGTREDRLGRPPHPQSLIPNEEANEPIWEIDGDDVRRLQGHPKDFVRFMNAVLRSQAWAGGCRTPRSI